VLNARTLLLSLMLVFAAQPILCQTDQANEIRCASGTACGSGFVPKFATNGGSATVNNSLIRQSSGNISISSKLGIGTTTPAERLDLGNGGNVVIKTDPGNDTTPGLVSYKLIGRALNGGTNTWAIYTAPVGGGTGVFPNSLSIWQYPSSSNPSCCIERFTIYPASTNNPTPPAAYVGGDGSLNARIVFATLAVESSADVDAAGCVVASGNVLGGTCKSDVRLKKNIQPFAHVLERVSRLQPVSFNWRAEEYSNELTRSQLSTGKASGLIAQDVEKVFPEMVSIDKQGFKQVNYSELPYLMLQAIRELKAENDDLKERLKTENEDLRERIKRLEQK